MSFTSTSMAGGADFEYPPNLTESNGGVDDEFLGGTFSATKFLDSLITTYETVVTGTTIIKVPILKLKTTNLDVWFTCGSKRNKEHEKMD